MATHSSVLACSPRDGGAWWAAICGVTQSQTRLKPLSSSSSSMMSAQGGICHLLNFSQTLNKLWPVFSYCTFFIYLASCAGSYGEGNGTPLQYSCLENPLDRGVQWAAVHGVANSQARPSNFTFTSEQLWFSNISRKVLKYISCLGQVA